MQKINKYRIVLCNCGDEKEAHLIAEALVNQGLAACVNIISGVESVYLWKGKVEKEREITLLIKTDAKKIDSIESLIEELHSYDVPEIITLPLMESSKKYLEWLEGELKFGK